MFQTIQLAYLGSSTSDYAPFTPAEQLEVENIVNPFPWTVNAQHPCKFNATIDSTSEAGVNIQGNPDNGITTTDDNYFSDKIVKFKGKIVITKIEYIMIN